jgi:hypothetical protein
VPTIIGKYDDLPAGLPDNLTLWNYSLVGSPLFLHIQYATYAKTGTKLVQPDAPQYPTSFVNVYEYTRTSFGGTPPE